MSKKTRKIIDNTALFAKQEAPKQARLDELERHNALVKAGEIYNNWQKRVVMQSRKIEELPDLLNLLAWELERDVRHEDLRQNIMRLVHQKMADVFTRVEMEKNIVRVLVDCPNFKRHPEQALEEGASPIEAFDREECGWGGEAAFHKAMWEEGKAQLECPQCKSILTKKDTALRSEVKVERPNLFVRYTPRIQRTGKILSKDQFLFITRDQLLGFSHVQEFSERPGFERYAMEKHNLFAIIEGKEELVGQIQFPEAVAIEPLTPSSAPAEASPGPSDSPTPTDIPAEPPAAGPSSPS